MRFLQQWAGYSMTADTSEHALAFFFGPGGNGKSVFLNTITGISGTYACTASTDTFAASKGDRHPVDLAMLNGARVVTSSETDADRPWNESRIKSLIGGDPIAARFMRRNPFTFRPVFKLSIAGNHRPTLRNVDEAARRRFLIVPFTRKPPVVDLELEMKLRAEWPGILRWALNGAVDWAANGLIRPAVIKEATQDYFESQDTIGQWLQENWEVRPESEDHWAASAHLFSDWRLFAENAGVAPGTAKSLGEVLGSRGFRKQSRRVGGTKTRGWSGLKPR